MAQTLSRLQGAESLEIESR